MAAMNFPNTPTPGQIYAPPGGPVYRYDDPLWTAVAGAGVPLEGVPEAPVDGTQYGRQSAAWTPVTGGGGGGGSMTAAEILTAIKTVDGAGSGLDADLLDGNSSAFFATASSVSGKLDSSSYTAADVLTKIKTVDGASSGLDADLLDAQESTYYLDLTNVTGTLAAARFTDTSHGARSGGALHADVIAAGASGFMTGADKTKLNGVATGATANSTDATLLARANHTGTQTASTISDFSTAADARVALKITNKITVASSAPGSPATNDVWIDTT